MSDQLWYTIPIDRFPERTGQLSVVERGKHVPFDVKRVFWVSKVPDASFARGAHSHAELQQVLFCAKGRCEIELEAVDGRKETFVLDEDGFGLFLDGPVWRTMRNFTPDCSLIVLCDREYAIDRVVRDYEEFKRL